MKRTFAAAGVLMACVVLSASGQAPRGANTLFAEQIRAAATLDVPRSPAPTVQLHVANERHKQHAAWIGAGIGAVALPLGGYLAFHDSDSGPPKAGGILLLGAIGALLGWMVGYLIG